MVVGVVIMESILTLGWPGAGTGDMKRHNSHTTFTDCEEHTTKKMYTSLEHVYTDIDMTCIDMTCTCSGSYNTCISNKTKSGVLWSHPE